jgi:muramoyltetrapeptide carboxypeptidase LdcA involved in peptidoglycan recycling
MPNAKKGVEYIKKHPEARAGDLKTAFRDDSIKAIVCAIGGDDTFRTVPYLMDDPEFITLVEKKPKIFLGFSDTTINHLMFYKLGLQTYYGPSFLTDFAEFADEMLPYTKEYIEELIKPSDRREIASSPIWYDERQSFTSEQVGTDRLSHDETRGFEVLRGSKIVAGELLGGCIESLGEALISDRYAEEGEIIEKYGIIPAPAEWRGKILFTETSEEKPTPERLSILLKALDDAGVLTSVSGILVGKPQDEVFYHEYKKVWLDVTKPYGTPILYNLNFGHATPRSILPYGARVEIDFTHGKVRLSEPIVSG